MVEDKTRKDDEATDADLMERASRLSKDGKMLDVKSLPDTTLAQAALGVEEIILGLGYLLDEDELLDLKAIRLAVLHELRHRQEIAWS